MESLWRISSHIDLDGNGGRFFSSRWSPIGRRIVYLSASPAGAMLEILVHLQYRRGRLPETYDLLEVEVTETMAIQPLDPYSEPGWKELSGFTQQLGGDWLSSAASPLARVPSAIIPHTWNYILNPEHPDSKLARIASVIRERFDNRLFRFGTR
jgi:RES domain-containing protein